MKLQSISIEHKGLCIRGTHYQNENRNVYSVLLVHGFGSNRIGVGRSFVTLTQQLIAKGFDVFSFDRLGHGESDGQFLDVSPHDEIKQLHKMLDFILALGYKKVHVVGHSLGGMESAKFAAQRPNSVQSLSLWAPAAVFAFEVAEKGEIQGKSIDNAQERGYFDFKGQKLGWNFIEEAKSFEPYQGLEAFKNKVFIHQGEKDDVVPMKYAECYLKVWQTNGTLYKYPNADHGWNSLITRTQLINKTVLNIIETSKAHE